jgi:hypothetical protein
MAEISMYNLVKPGGADSPAVHQIVNGWLTVREAMWCNLEYTRHTRLGTVSSPGLQYRSLALQTR